jgi:flagellar M-ring protein FliF
MQSVLREMGTTRLLVMACVALLMLAVFGFLAFRISSPNMVPLYSNLSAEDSNGVISQLAGMGIPHEVQSGGAQIMVPADQVPVIRARMASEGLPSKGAIVGYEIFDKSELMGSSHFVQNVNLIRALEGELARTLRGFAKISEARVHVVLPKRELFARADQNPTASVMVKVKGGQTLERAEVAAISHLVASAVPGLSPLRVTIVDVKGNPLKLATESEDEPGLIAATSEEYRIQFQNHLKKNVQELLERSVGAGRVVAQVSADIDFDRVVTNAEIYDPDGQVIRSIQAVEEKEVSQDGKADDVSVQSNLPAGSGENNAAAASGNSVQRTNETTNYEISKTVKNHVSESGSIKKLSVAVLVDGIYTGEAEAETYQPRTAEELQKLEGLVKTAIGFDEARGDQVRVENMAFSRDEKMTMTESPFAWITQDLGGVVQTLVVGVVVTLIILLVIRPVVSRAFEISKSDNEDAELQAALSGMGDVQMLAGGIETRSSNYPEEKPSIDIERFEEKMKSSSLGTVNEIVERHPDETLTIIRNWLGQEANGS